MPRAREATENATKREYFPIPQKFDKENVELNADNAKSFFACNKATFRERISSDNSYDRPRKFQNVNVANQVQATADARDFVKPRFPVYKDKQGDGAHIRFKVTALDDKDVDKSEVNRQEKTTRVLGDYLPTELMYNISYMNEFITYQEEIHKKKVLPLYYLTRGLLITAEQRRLIVEHLIKSSAYAKYPSFVTYQAVKIFDFFVATAGVAVRVDDLQTAGLASLWIALKKDMKMDDVPSASQLLNKFSGSSLKGNTKALVEYEKKILTVLKFDVFFEDPFSVFALLLSRIPSVQELESEDIQKIYYCGSYLIDVSLLLEDMCNVSAVHLSVISAEIAMWLYFTNDHDLDDPQWTRWRDQVFTSNPTINKNFSMTDHRAGQLRTLLIQKAIQTKKRDTDFYTVYRKYGTSRYGSVSQFLTKKLFTLYVSKTIDPSRQAQPVTFF